MNDPTGESQVPQNLLDLLEAELEPGEHVVWTGMPVARAFDRVTAGTSLGGLIWSVLCFPFVASVLYSAWGNLVVFVPIAVFLGAFVAIGIHAMASPGVNRWRLGRTLYALTNRRAITIERFRALTIRSYSLFWLQDIHRRENWNGSGDLVFDEDVWQDTRGRSHSRDRGFLRLKDPRAVGKILSNLLQQRFGENAVFQPAQAAPAPREEIPKALRARLDRELGAGERLLWIDGPEPLYFTEESRNVFRFGIIWMLFSIFAVSIAVVKVGWAATILVWIFPAAGVAMLLSPFWTRWKALHTVYAITDHRVVTLYADWRRWFNELPLTGLRRLEIDTEVEAGGDVIFERAIAGHGGVETYRATLVLRRLGDPRALDAWVRSFVPGIEKNEDDD